MILPILRIKNDKKQFCEILRNIMEDTFYVKFIIINSSATEINLNEVTFKLKEFDDINTLKLILHHCKDVIPCNF